MLIAVTLSSSTALSLFAATARSSVGNWGYCGHACAQSHVSNYGSRGRTSEYFKIGSGEHRMQEQAGSTGDELRTNVVHRKGTYRIH